MKFNHIFKKKGLPTDFPTVTFTEKEIEICDLLHKAHLVASKSEARRLIEQGGVKIDQEKVQDARLKVKLSQPFIIQCGKRKFARIERSKN